jgi:hypothetical protein
MSKHNFPTTTTGIWKAGIGITLTRANVRMENDRRVEEAKQNKQAIPSPMTADEILAAFMPKGGKGHPLSTVRHERRAASLAAKA